MTIQRHGEISNTVTFGCTTVDDSARAGVDFVSISGLVELAPEQNYSILRIRLLPNPWIDGDRSFRIVLRVISSGVLLTNESMQVTIVDDEVAGAVDTAFQPNIEGAIDTLNLRPDGRIQLTGSFPNTGSWGRHFALCLNPDGTPWLDYQSEDAILIAGQFTSSDSLSKFSMIRFRLNGEVDPSFQLTPEVTEAITALKAQPDGRLLTAQSMIPSQLFRLRPDGSLDTSFAINGRLTSRITALLLQADGKILVDSDLSVSNHTVSRYVTRLFPDGSIDLGLKLKSNLPTDITTMLLLEPHRLLVTGGSTRYYLTNFYHELSPQGRLEFSSNDVRASEADPEVTVRVRRWDGKQGEVTCGYVTLNETAENGQDYIGVQGTIAFAPDEMEKTITVPLLNDERGEKEESFIIQLVEPAGGVMLGTWASTRILLRDDETTVAFTAPHYTVNEGDGRAEISLCRYGNLQTRSEVALTTLPGTALEGQESHDFPARLVFEPGIAELTVPIPLLDDRWPEESKILKLRVTALSGCVIAEDAYEITLQIRDDDGVGRLDDSFVPWKMDPLPDGPSAFALDLQGRLLVGGLFLRVYPYTSIGETNLSSPFLVVGDISCFNPDGTLSSDFPYDRVSGYLWPQCIVVQSNGMVLAGGRHPVTYGSSPLEQRFLARFYPDGTLDPEFSVRAGVEGAVHAIAPMANGQVLIGGKLTTVGGVSRGNLVRLNADGSVDPGFDAMASTTNSTISQILVQPGDKVLYATYNNLGRLYADGSPDPSFPTKLQVNGYVLALVPQPDGQVLVGGAFSDFDGRAVGQLVRLQTEGSLDPTFRVPRLSGPTVGGIGPYVRTVLVSADGKLVVGGRFTNINGVVRNNLARLHADGSVDPEFDPGEGPNGSVSFITPAKNGNLLICGTFTSVNGMPRSYLAQVHNTFHERGLLAFTSPRTVVSEDQRQVEVGIRRLMGAEGTVCVDYTLQDVTARIGLDYLGEPGQLVFAPGEVEKTIPFTILGETAFEPEKSFTIVLERPTGGVLLSQGPEHQVLIRDVLPGFNRYAKTARRELQVTMNCRSNTTCILECSTNLVDWQPIATNRTVDSEWRWAPNSTNHIPSGFYRFKQVAD